MKAGIRLCSCKIYTQTNPSAGTVQIRDYRLLVVMLAGASSCKQILKQLGISKNLVGFLEDASSAQLITSFS